MLKNYGGKFLEATIRAIDGIIWIASDVSAPEQLQIGILNQTSIVLIDGLQRQGTQLRCQVDPYAIVTKQEVRELLAALFPVPGYRDLHSVHLYRCNDQSEVVVERVAKNIYRLSICNTSVHCDYDSARKFATALALASIKKFRIDH